MNLSQFLRQNAEDILVQWEAFAKTLEPAAALMSNDALRDHAHQIIKAIALDIESVQSEREQIAKSHGDGPTRLPQSAASVHGTLREVSGFSLVQLTAEFRALRASVLRLWLPTIGEFNEEVHEELVRFNEAVDQALAESAATYSEHTDKTRERFLAILGHDLRTPLAAISMTGALLVRSKSVEANAVIGKRLTRSAATMSSMVNDLLEYSRTQLGGKMPISAVPANLGEIAKAALDDAASANPECVFEYASHGDLSGIFDPVRVQQVVVNLLANAAQYRAKETSVLLNVAGAGDEVVVSVTNFGPAIPPAALQTIFNAMVQLPVEGEHSGRPRTSLGLGLFIARETTLAHGGAIHVASTDAQGTTFAVRLPRAVEPGPRRQ
ncbi:sensor histidine kinase [Variovorax saccharolyticus]|uniref:sensor histidine kinase n=1 Tax=Variovorax saccharolyticus TaxID=3053516 RepID=UPI0025759769|nr:sensor histidine kinase [Variovorax sp. J22R187]MDM0022858.1 sensor histidine kinase [Variovorax sp. J22R187]